MEGRLRTRITQDPDELFVRTLEILPEGMIAGDSLDRVWSVLEEVMKQVMDGPVLADNCRGTTQQIPSASVFSSCGAVRSEWVSTTLAARRLGTLCHTYGGQLMERCYTGNVGRIQFAFEEIVPRETFLTAAGALRSRFAKGVARVAEDANRLLSGGYEVFYPILIQEAEEYLVRLIGEPALARYQTVGATSKQLLTAYASLLQLAAEADAGGFPKGPYAVEVSVAPRCADVQPGRIDQLALVEVEGKAPTRRHLTLFAELTSGSHGRRSAEELTAACTRRMRDPVLQVHDLKFEVGDGSDRTRGEITKRSYKHCLREHGRQVGVYLDACNLTKGTIVYATPSLERTIRRVPVAPGNLQENLNRVDWNRVVVARAARKLKSRLPVSTRVLQEALF